MTYCDSRGNSPLLELSRLQHQSPASNAQRTTSTPRSSSTTPTLSPTGLRLNDEGPGPTLVGRTAMVTANRKDRPDDVVPTQLETGGTAVTTVELPGDRSTVGITSSRVQEPGRPLAEA
ncbi:unnamed protein product [Echinostoma caproni]|uniref:Uncharacterized protein n=1 Tax=Echinostoma caproni TaxID=27848 RepID=A0A183BEC9_9TREM|nr:unnamed protein product [Echinostoma caproni]